MREYPNGQTIRLKATFRDIDSALVDPTTITLKAVRMVGETSTSVLSKVKADLTHASTGIYYYDYTPTDAGIYRYRFVGTGTVTSTHEDAEFRVLETSL